MTQPTPFNLIMVSAEMEHGGNLLHRHFDGHPNCFTYGFESQLGTEWSRNILCPLVHPVRYGYSAFEVHPDWTDEQRFNDALTQIWDEECKAYVRNPQRSKFRDCGLVMSEHNRRNDFIRHCLVDPMKYGVWKPFTRATVVEAYFRSFFDAWGDLNRSGKETHYVGYNPGMVADTDKLFADFPNAHVIHVVRNPFSAYADYLKRPYGQQSMEKYFLAYNVGHSLAFNFAHKYPGRFHLIRLEDFLTDKRGVLEPILGKIGLPWDDALLKPSFNGRDLSDHLPPWGTVEKPTTEYNLAMANSHSPETKIRIANECALIIKTFGYGELVKSLGLDYSSI